MDKTVDRILFLSFPLVDYLLTINPLRMNFCKCDTSFRNLWFTFATCIYGLMNIHIK